MGDVETLPKDKLFGMDIKLLRKKPAEDVVFLMYEHVVQTCPSHEHPVEQKPDEEKPVEKKPEEKKPGKPDKSDKFGDKKKPMEEDIKPEEEKPVEQKPDEKKPEEKKPEEKKPGKPDKSLPFDIDFSLLKNKSPQQIAVILRELILKNPEEIGIDVENLPKDKLFGMDIKLLRKKPAEDVVFLMYEHVVQTCPSHEHPVEQKPDE